jgi:hypothetical protein
MRQYFQLTDNLNAPALRRGAAGVIGYHAAEGRLHFQREIGGQKILPSILTAER